MLFYRELVRNHESFYLFIFSFLYLFKKDGVFFFFFFFFFFYIAKPNCLTPKPKYNDFRKTHYFYSSRGDYPIKQTILESQCQILYNKVNTLQYAMHKIIPKNRREHSKKLEKSKPEEALKAFTHEYFFAPPHFTQSEGTIPNE
eukprot:TRINITY_DN59680_c0_g1_i1.p1 TRINITY_DN59680_c0_g1~~TRINITY_DN59680_c0_g1_i1.p1  ORF type:complete len:144 (-),score=27.39 TRINITY_DN59680_c0_g1_i1:55-486(-)